MKKPPGGRDARQEPAPDAPEESAANFRVDRVFSSQPQTPGTTTPAGGATGTRPPVSASTASLMSSARTRRVTNTSSAETESELSLRRQMSRLQRQLADAQRELANKDDELAAEVEKRADAIDAHDALLEELQLHKAHLDELLAYRARTTGVEQRLQESVATADELVHVLELERGKLAAATSRGDELQAHFDDARSRWTAERLKLDEQRATETAAIEASKRTAIEAAGAAMEAATERLRAAHEEELAQLRGAHERSVATLRGDLEPKALQARSLAEERERLTSELAAVKTEHARVSAERDEAHQRELTHVSELHASDQTALMQRHATELARVTSERDEKAEAVEQAGRAAELREQYWETTVASLREAQKKLQREVAEAKERIAALETDKASVDERLATATATSTQLSDDKRALTEKLEASETEARRNALDRARFVAYLEEGLALLGALPAEAPAPADPEPKP